MLAAVLAESEQPLVARRASEACVTGPRSALQASREPGGPARRARGSNAQLKRKKGWCVSPLRR